MQQSVIALTISSRTSLGSRFTRKSRDLRNAATNLWEMSLILSRDSFMLSPVSRPDGADHFALRDQGVLDPPEHLLIADALAAHVFAVLAQQSRTSSFSRSSTCQLFFDTLAIKFGRARRIGGFKYPRGSASGRVATTDNR